MAKNDQAWIGLHEDEVRWLLGVIERVPHGAWAEGGDLVFCEALKPRLTNLLTLYPGRRNR